jgi:hypothetical protein
MMDVKELLDDDAFDPEKLFDDKKYRTLIIDREGFNRKENNVADLLEGLLDKDVSRYESEEIFKRLKELKAQDMMIDAIKTAERVSEKAVLTAACWETGLDFSAHFLFFVELALSADFNLGMEALTVIEYAEGGIAESEVNKAIELTENSTTADSTLKRDLLTELRSRLPR